MHNQEPIGQTKNVHNARAQSYANRNQLYRAGAPAATRWLSGRDSNLQSCMHQILWMDLFQI